VKLIYGSEGIILSMIRKENNFLIGARTLVKGPIPDIVVISPHCRDGHSVTK